MLPNNPSRLLELPAELRNRIYEFVFADSEVHVRKKDIFTHLRYRPPHAGILMACRQTYSESLTIFYDFTTFYLGPNIMGFFLRSLPHRNACLVSKVRLDTNSSRGSIVEDSYFVEEAQDELFWAQHVLKTYGIAVPTTMQAKIFDSNLSSRDIVWTSTPWQTFEELYPSFPSKLVSGLQQRRYD